MAATPQKQHMATSLLSRAHSPTTTAAIFKDRIKQKPLLLRPSSPDPTLDARAQRRKRRQAKEAAQRKSRKPKPLSAKQKRALCLYDIPKEQRKYAVYEPLHDMWCDYVRDILGLGKSSAAKGKYITPAAAGPMLVSADFHGAGVEVVRSRCVGRVGIRGIVVKDTRYTFEVITRANELKTVPKEHSVFQIELPIGVEQVDGVEIAEHPKSLVFEIYGSQFEHRPTDRATKKFRQHADPDL